MEFQGLSNREVVRLREKFGLNTLPEKSPLPLWQRFFHQFQNPLIYILLFALLVDLIIRIIEKTTEFPLESAAICLILLINSFLGVYQENKAESALARLKLISVPQISVVRHGNMIRIPSSELVPGEIIRLEAGERVPADGELIKAQGVAVDESLLTGESIPVEKDEQDEIFSGTLFVRGKSYAKITRTGEQSAMGKLAVMIGDIESGKTPLQKRLDIFGRQIAYFILCLALFLVIAGIFIEGIGRLGHILLFAVALAVAAVPEGLPAILTLTLSLGVERMASRKAIVRRLSAVEALGSVTVIATDKTGTLTKNKMFVKDVDSPEIKLALRTMVLVNDAEIGAGVGDPLELSLLEYARSRNINILEEQNKFPRKSVLPFDSQNKFMRVTVFEKGYLKSYLKGAPEIILSRSILSPEERKNWEEKAEGYARDGFRVLGIGWRNDEGESEIHFGGLILLWDPPRPEVPESIRLAQEAGIRVVMITGDHPATALSIAHEVGIPPSRVLTGFDIENLNSEALGEAVKNVNIFARVAPEHKLRLVEALQKNKEVVAVTGDGVNDAPALKRSDVGVAMGDRGSDVSREVADLVLMDDNFATIVAAIEEGRSIYENIQKFNRFLFSTNLSLVLLVIGGSVGSFIYGLQDIGGGLLLPLTAVQLLWINVIGNGPPALALGLDKNEGVMQKPPRDPYSPLLDRASIKFILFTGIFKAGIGGILLMMLPILGYGILTIRTAIFIFESLAQLFFSYPSRRISTLPTLNPALHLAVGIGVAVQLMTLFIPFLRDLLGLVLLDLQILIILLLTIPATWAIAETYSWFVQNTKEKIFKLFWFQSKS